MNKTISTAVCLIMLAACAKAGRLTAHGGSEPPRNQAPTGPNSVSLNPEDFPNVKNSIFGVWAADTAEFGENMTFLTTLYFNDDGELGVQRTCIGGGQIIAATLVKALASKAKIEIKESSQVTEKLGPADCTVAVSAGKFSYTVKGDNLTASFGPGEARTFTRLRE